MIYFSGNVEVYVKNQIVQLLGVRLSNNPKKYLGLPTMMGLGKKNAFTDIKDKFLKRLALGA